MYESSLSGIRTAIANNKSLSHRAVKSDIRKIVSQRFIEAREMNGFSQSEASARIGYKTSAQLCQWEQGKRLPPIDQMVIASMVYGVALDFLYGLSTEAERDPRVAAQHALMRQVQDLLTVNAQAVAGALIKQANAGGPSMIVVQSLCERAGQSAAAVRRFRELNPKKFDTMAGSNTAMVAAATLEDCAREATALLNRQRNIKYRSAKEQEKLHKLSYPLFETPEYLQGQLELAQ